MMNMITAEENGHAHRDRTVHYDYSPGAAQAQADALLSVLLADIPSEEHFYLLADPVPLLKLSQCPFRDALVARRPVPVKLPHATLAVTDYPWLLTLDLKREEDAALLRQSVDFALAELHPDKLCEHAGRALCGWLYSPFDAQTVAKQLGDTAIQRGTDQAQLLMRYYDPAAHSLLWPQLKPFQQKRLMGILSRWVFVDGDGKPVVHSHTPDAIPHYTCLLGLADEQVRFILNDTATITHALRQYRKRATGASRYPELTCAAQIMAALARTDGHPAFASQEQRETFAYHILRHHPRIDLHPQIKYLLMTDTFHGPVPWSDRVSKLTSAQWQQYARDCDAQENPTTTEITP